MILLSMVSRKAQTALPTEASATNTKRQATWHLPLHTRRRTCTLLLALHFHHTRSSRLQAGGRKLYSTGWTLGIGMLLREKERGIRFSLWTHIHQITFLRRNSMTQNSQMYKMMPWHNNGPTESLGKWSGLWGVPMHSPSKSSSLIQKFNFHWAHTKLRLGWLLSDTR